jgi:hypothetical protein
MHHHLTSQHNSSITINGHKIKIKNSSERSFILSKAAVEEEQNVSLIDDLLDDLGKGFGWFLF